MPLSGVMTSVEEMSIFVVITALNVLPLTALNSYITWANLWHMRDLIETGTCERELKGCFVN